MRFSTGTQIVYGKDSDGPAVQFSGELESRTVAPGTAWTLDDEKKDGRRTWRPVKGKTLTRPQRPIDNGTRDVLSKHLATLTPSGRHPALDDFGGEAKRLFPMLFTSANKAFKALVKYLAGEFGLEPGIWDGKPRKPFVDDFGPELLVYIDGKATPLPEMPPVYSAPAVWQPAMWAVTNSMFGPFVDTDLPPEKEVIFSGADDIRGSKSEVEGLMYFHGARFCVMHEAWLGNPSAPLLVKFSDLITGGLRPWRDNQEPATQ